MGGKWAVVVGDWLLAVSGWQPVGGQQLAVGGWRLTALLAMDLQELASLSFPAAALRVLSAGLVLPLLGTIGSQWVPIAPTFRGMDWHERVALPPAEKA